MKSEIFHTANIGSIEFTGWISFDGPRISSNEGGSVNLGPCSIRHFEPDVPRAGVALRQGWYVVKYTSEVKIPLRNFTEADAVQLSSEFGIPIRHHTSGQAMGLTSFYLSPAFEGLKVWVRNHPRKAKQLSDLDGYLPDWYDKAISSNS